MTTEEMIFEGCEALAQNGFDQQNLHVEKHGDKFYVVLDAPSDVKNASEIEAVLPVYNAHSERVTA